MNPCSDSTGSFTTLAKWQCGPLFCCPFFHSSITVVWSRLLIFSCLSSLFTYQGLTLPTHICLLLLLCFAWAKVLISSCLHHLNRARVLISSCLHHLNSLWLTFPLSTPPQPVYCQCHLPDCHFPTAHSASRIKSTLLSLVSCAFWVLAPASFSGSLLLCSLTYYRLLGTLLSLKLPPCPVLYFNSWHLFIPKPTFPSISQFTVQDQIWPFFPSAVFPQHFHKSFSLERRNPANNNFLAFTSRVES